MTKILIVDDDPDKTSRILNVLTSIRGLNVTRNVETVQNAIEARSRLREKHYDLMILDIALPEKKDSDPVADGGVKLLAEVAKRTTYKKPREIIGLTAYPDVFLEALPKFNDELWHVIQFDATSELWADQLKRKVKYIQFAIKNPQKAVHGCDLCVVTALYAPEFRAILDLPWQWRDLEVEREVTNFKIGSFRSSGKARKVIAACSSRMGMTAAAVTASKLIYNFHPRYIAMTGITAGFKGTCSIGDIVVADPTWDYGSGKWEGGDDGPVFKPSPHQFSLPAFLRSRFLSLAQNQEVLDKIRRDWSGNSPSSALRMHIGPMATGSAVLADGETSAEILDQNRKAIGLEMEAYGLMAAAHEAPLPDVRAFVIKSVSDYADAEKADGFQAYAAYSSAAALRVFAENYLP
jgi:nucleoside phosphorylase/CheY-like chemotaxis protein